MVLTNFLFSQVSSTAEAVEGLLGIEVLGSLGGVVFIIYTLYKLGTIETVLKMLLTVLIGIVLLYAAGVLTPQLQDANWYRLIAFIVENVPGILLDEIGGNVS